MEGRGAEATHRSSASRTPVYYVATMLSFALVTLSAAPDPAPATRPSKVNPMAGNPFTKGAAGAGADKPGTLTAARGGHTPGWDAAEAAARPAHGTPGWDAANAAAESGTVKKSKARGQPIPMPDGNLGTVTRAGAAGKEKRERPSKLPEGFKAPGGLGQGLGHFPAPGGTMGGSELQKQSIAMHEWFCAEAGNAEKLPCLMHQARSSSDKAEKKALYARMRPDPKDTKVGEERKLTMGAMHEAWCARDDARETALCVNWRGSAARRAEAAAKKEAHKATPNYGSEYVEMHTAYCDDKPENAETAPCVMHAMRDKSLSADAKKALAEKVKAVAPMERVAQRETLMKFWCEDPVTPRAGSGVCLSWRKRRQASDLHAPEEMAKLDGMHTPKEGGLGGRGGGPPGGRGGLGGPKGFNMGAADMKPIMSEMEHMHEWYCTKLDDTHDKLVCARWRLRLKEAADAYDADARAKDSAFVDAYQQKRGAEQSELNKKIHEAKEQGQVEESARLTAALKKVRQESQKDFFEMHRAWCDEGPGKEQEEAGESIACKRYREWASKTEL